MPATSASAPPRIRILHLEDSSRDAELIREKLAAAGLACDIIVADSQPRYRAALEGTYWQVFQFAAPVLAVTLGTCLLAIRWAVEQFNSESVLFREGERLDVRLWLHHLFEDRGPTPTAAGALMNFASR